MTWFLYALLFMAQASDCVLANKVLAQAERESLDPAGLARRQDLYTQATTSCPSSAEAFNNLADTLERLGRFDEALAAYRTAIGLRGEWALPYFGLGDVYRRLDRLDEALYWYEKGLAFDPSDQEAQEFVRRERAKDPADIVRWQRIGPSIEATRGPGVMASVAFDEKRLPFDSDRATLRGDARAQIREIAFALRDRFSNTRGLGVVANVGPPILQVVGHADLRGSDAYNRELAQRRAQAVVDELVRTFAIPRSRLTATSYGRSRPICSDDTEACHARNRRVEIQAPR